MTEITKHEGGAVGRAQEAAPMQSVVEYALTHNIDPESLGRLLDAQDRVAERNARVAFLSALAAFQAECPLIKKSKTAKIATKSGGSYGYTYAPLDEITRTVTPLLAKHGFMYSWDSEQTDTGITATFILEHVDGHTKRNSFTAPMDTAAAMSGAQKGGAAATYARRQSMEMGLGLTTSDDTDAAMPTQPMAPKIQPGRAADLQALAEEVGQDLGKMFGHYGVEGFGDMTPDQADHAQRIMEKKRGGS